MTTVLDEFDIKADWSELPFKAVAMKVSESGFPELESLSVFLDAGVVPRSSREDNHNQLGESLDKYQRVLPGDLVFNRLRTWQGGFGISNYEGIVSPAYIVARLDQSLVDPRFLDYLLKSKPYLTELTRLSKWMPPTQFDISWESVRDLKLRIPSIEEQRNIANYLDESVHKINRLISLKKETIALNLEVFNSSRHELVTGRKHPYLIETDVGWLDTVPKSWKKAPLRSLVSIQKGKDPARLNLDYCTSNPGEFPVYSGQTENDGLFARISTFDFNISGSALLIRTVGTLNLVGTTTLISGKFSLSQNCALILPRSNDVNMTYLHYVLPSLLEIKKAGIPSDMQASLRFSDLSQYWLHWPSVDEQDRIASEISVTENYIKNMNELIKNSINLLEDYRSSLITEAVTGFLSVFSNGTGAK